QPGGGRQRPQQQHRRRHGHAGQRHEQPRAALAGPARAQRGLDHLEERMRVAPGRRHVDVAPAPQPEHEGGDEHQRARDAERHRRAEVAQEQRRQQRGEERAEVDDPVERVEDDLGLVLVALVELVAAEAHHQRLDAAGAERDQEQAGVEAGGVVLEQRQAGVAGAIDQREPQDRVVLAEEAVGQPSPQQREEVHADHEHVEDVLGRAVALRSGRQVSQQRRADQERHQDVAHAVEAEALARLVADDVGDLAGHAPLAGGGGAHPGSVAKETEGTRSRPRAGTAASHGCRPPAALASWPFSPLVPPMSFRLRLPPAWLLAAACALPLPAPASADPLSTVAERSGFQRTGRYDEVPALAAAFQARWPDKVRALSFGTTPEGRPMQLLVVTATGAFEPEQARRRKLPVVLVQGGIHAGEIDGKDAGFLALREILEGKAAPGVLDKVVWLFVPVFNVDGHERFGAWNRPNQRGPEEMGWRTTAQGYNLNRDYLKADSPEMQAMLALVRQWDPLAMVDLHATDGAQFEHDVSVQVEPVHAGDEALRQAGRQWRDGVIADLARAGSLPLDFYPSFIVEDDPASGFADDVSPPRFSHGYFLLRNRFGMLV